MNITVEDLSENISDSYEKLLENFKHLESDYKLKFKEDIENIFKKIKNSFPSEMLKVLDKQGILMSFDENIYDYCSELIFYYKTTSELYENLDKNSLSQDLINTFDNIFYLLNKRIIRFQDSHNLIECKDFNGNTLNPIYYEKRSIMEKIFNEFYVSLDAIQESLDSSVNECSLCNDKTTNIFSFEIIDKIQNLFSGKIEECLERLSLLENRKSAKLYYDLLSEETAILTDIVSQHLKSVENPNNSISKVINKLIETFNHANKSMTSTKILCQQRCLENNFNVNINIEELLNSEIYLDNLNFEISELKSQFEAFVSILTEELSNLCTSYIQNTLTSNLDLSKNIIIAFSEIVNYNCIKQVDDKKTNEIIMGVLETIEIKLDILNEAQESLEASILSKVKNINSFGFNENIFEYWLDYVEKQEFLNSEDNFLLDEFYLYNQKHLDKINKIFLQFKRDTVLYEISTFEEIINYSISLLRDSDEKNVKEFVFAIDNAMCKIENNLIKINIKPIKPLPHDMFNGKFHEVLVAEKNDQFKKGEIIKVMNSGFIQDQTVIMRANVIAAK